MGSVDPLSPGWQALLPWAERDIPIPPRSQLTAAELEDRVRGMLLGLAIGDALGNTSESQTPARRRRRYGEIRDYLPNWWADMLSQGLPSDDSQLAFWTLESMLRCGGLDPADVAATFAGDRIFGIGQTVTEFLLAYRAGRPWYEAGRPSAGNGALMRIAPVVLPYLRAMDKALWTDVIAATVITHRDEAAVTASVGFMGLLTECLALPVGEGSGPSAGWWPQTFLRYGRPVEIGVSYDRKAPTGAFTGSLCDLVAAEVVPAIEAGLGVLEATEQWHSGAYLLQTVPCVLHILACHGLDPEEAIVRAVNDTWDNDTIGALVGTAVGALHGASALPERWTRDLLGRTRESDDGRVQELVNRAMESFLSQRAGGCGGLTPRHESPRARVLPFCPLWGRHTKEVRMAGWPQRLTDRRDAGRMLARELSRFATRDDAVVLGLPRGGVVVAFEVADALGLPLDIYLVRKLGAPGQEELAIGAIASGGARVLNDDIVRALELQPEQIEAISAREKARLEERERLYRGHADALDIDGKLVILVDDGLATGASMRIAVRSLRDQGPAGIVVAVPVAPGETCTALAREADEVVCPLTPAPFYSIGSWYEDFSQTSDKEVIDLLESARSSGRDGVADGEEGKEGPG